MNDTPAEIALPGGNVGGAVRIGDTVRRPAGYWTPAVHALLNYLADAGLDGVPRVHGYDDQGREVLDFLPGTTPGTDEQQVSDDLLVQGLRWLRRYHEAVASFRPAGEIRWRTATAVLGEEQIVCMHDFGWYNWVADGNEFAGAIDWDMAAPGVPMDDIAFCAWNTAALVDHGLAPGRAADRLRLMASAYGGVEPLAILHAAPERAMRSVRVIRAGQLAGDPGMLNLGKVGEPERTERHVVRLRERVPAIAAEL